MRGECEKEDCCSCCCGGCPVALVCGVVVCGGRLLVWVVLRGIL